MKQLKKMNSFTIQVLEGVDPMSDVNLAEIKGGGSCFVNIVTTCPCNNGTQTNPPLKPKPKISALESEVPAYLSFE